jgi:hypothetical protein
MTISWRSQFLTFSQQRDRLPISYGASSFFAISPSSSCWRVAASIASPSPTWNAGTCHVAPFGAGTSDDSSSRRSRYGRDVTQCPSA